MSYSTMQAMAGQQQLQHSRAHACASMAAELGAGVEVVLRCALGTQPANQSNPNSVKCTMADHVQATGEDYNVEEGEGKRQFRALLDVGLVRITTGNRVFGALKGALDGGLDIPHSEKHFPGFSKEDKSLNAKTHCKYILGGHIVDYMRLLKDHEPEKFQSRFSGFIKEGVEAGDLVDMYTKVHAAICADPAQQKTEKKAPEKKRTYC